MKCYFTHVTSIVTLGNEVVSYIWVKFFFIKKNCTWKLIVIICIMISLHLKYTNQKRIRVSKIQTKRRSSSSFLYHYDFIKTIKTKKRV